MGRRMVGISVDRAVQNRVQATMTMGKACPDAEVEGQSPPEPQTVPVGHGHDVVGTRRGGGDHRIGEERIPGKHGA